MSLAKIFEEALESMEVQNLHALIVGLCSKAVKHRIIGHADEAKFVKIIGLLLGLADYRVRANAAEQLADTKGLPPEIYLYFACDDITIAGMFLEPGSVLPPASQVHIAKYTTTEHRLMLVARKDLSPEAVQEIMRTNDVRVIRAMNENETAALFYEYDDSPPGELDNRLQSIIDDLSGGESKPSAKENPLDTMIKLFCEKSRFVDIIEVLAKNGQLPKETVKGLFANKDSEPISILCKGLGVSEEAYGALAKFRCRRLGQLERLADTAREQYPGIDGDYAKAMLIELQGSAVRMVRAKSQA
ncbi:MAG: hypothetical protein H2045_09325 [Rhizobiales bacterium]|nr:hypothetical protein [Hyphomicrobiales bacterium]